MTWEDRRPTLTGVAESGGVAATHHDEQLERIENLNDTVARPSTPRDPLDWDDTKTPLGKMSPAAFSFY
jgi:hypothetical protein